MINEFEKLKSDARTKWRRTNSPGRGSKFVLKIDSAMQRHNKYAYLRWSTVKHVNCGGVEWKGNILKIAKSTWIP